MANNGLATRDLMPKDKSKKGEGFHSAAGLIRYFDAEDETAIKVDPKAVLVLCVGLVVAVELAKYFFPV
jgi:preprotein translocase subunit Sec61beta